MGRNSLVPHILERHLVVNVTEGIDEEASKGCHRGVGVVRACVHGGPVDGEEKKDLSRDCRPIYIGKTYRIA
jgi:hypothetical protein